jgi:hypothetical protein
LTSNALAAVLPTALILLSLAIMASRTLAPVRAKAEGKLEYEMRLGLLQRVLTNKVNILSISALIALGGGAIGNTPWLGSGLGYIALAVMIGLLFVPQKVVMTSAGVQSSRAVFRPWKDFDGYQVNGRKLLLHGKARLSSLKLYSSAKNLDAVEGVMRRHIRRGPQQRTPSARTRARRGAA